MVDSRPLKVVSEGPVAEIGGRQFLLHADRIGRDLRVTVGSPSATPFVPGQKFPVILALDDGFGVAGPLARLLGLSGAMAPAIVVSVGYPPDAPPTRNDDLTHGVATGLDGTTTFGGGGAAFQTFLAQDLMPFIAGRFAVDTARSILVGHSIGGLFAANVLAERPDAYGAYVIGSPSLWADPALVQRVEKAVAKARSGRVFLAVGSHEDGFQIDRGMTPMLTGFARLDAALQSQPRITLRSQVYPGEGHLSVYSRLILDAFPFVLPPRRPLTAVPAKLSAKQQARYIGPYALPDGRKLTISGLGRQVYAQVEGLSLVPLAYIRRDHFYASTSDLDVTFDATGVSLTGGGSATLRARRA